MKNVFLLIRRLWLWGWVKLELFSSWAPFASFQIFLRILCYFPLDSLKILLGRKGKGKSLLFPRKDSRGMDSRGKWKKGAEGKREQKGKRSEWNGMGKEPFPLVPWINQSDSWWGHFKKIRNSQKFLTWGKYLCISGPN